MMSQVTKHELEAEIAGLRNELLHTRFVLTQMKREAPLSARREMVLACDRLRARISALEAEIGE